MTQVVFSHLIIKINLVLEFTFVYIYMGHLVPYKYLVHSYSTLVVYTMDELCLERVQAAKKGLGKFRLLKTYITYLGK